MRRIPGMAVPAQILRNQATHRQVLRSRVTLKTSRKTMASQTIKTAIRNQEIVNRKTHSSLAIHKMADRKTADPRTVDPRPAELHNVVARNFHLPNQK